MSYSWRHSVDTSHVGIWCEKSGLFSKGSEVPSENWPTETELPGCSLLRYLVDTTDAAINNDRVLLSHITVASLTEDQASLLGLPSSIPYALKIDSIGTLDEQTFALSYEWRRYGAVRTRISRTGSIASDADTEYRVPAPLHELIESIDDFNKADTSKRERRAELWIPVQEAIAALTGANVDPDGYIKDLKVFHATAFSLDINFTTERGIEFDPILFSRRYLFKRQLDLFEADPLADPAELDDNSRSEAGTDFLVDESDQLLPPELQSVFLKNRFGKDAVCRESYPLARSTYVVLDASLRLALDVVKKVQQEDEQSKRAFVKNPRTRIQEELSNAGAEAVAALFVETSQYADRVTGIGLWQPKVLPWLPREKNTWVPEKLGFRIGDKTYELDPQDLPALKEECLAAREKGASSFNFKNVASIPISDDTIETIDELIEAAKAFFPREANEGQSKVEREKNEKKARFVLEHQENFETLVYKEDSRERHALVDDVPPTDLIPENLLFPHQVEGFEWLRRSWEKGSPGVLLADDMGLGKTIQTLAFCAWLDKNLEKLSNKHRGPFLIVAPTALLKNWNAEHERHLTGGGIGPIVELYGNSLASYRKSREDRRADTVVGTANLDRGALMSASVILTTYETLSNYHMSFARIFFPLVIFDEVQKLKTPTTINTHAAKTLNSDFVIGLTGTPVENALSELWSIMDRVSPGLLGDLKSFNKTFKAEDHSSLRELNDVLTKPSATAPGLMLRRMKEKADLGRALPDKRFQRLEAEMPPVQAAEYEKCIQRALAVRGESGKRGDMLQILQSMRSISLHPESPMSVLGQLSKYEAYISNSARLSSVVKALDEISAKGEKALIFVELREMQTLLADLLLHRYEFAKRPSIINGQTPSGRRQELVDEFQQSPPGRFDLMILAPRAAGVGLTITAANHVLHLSRWWNPAVEDQCNDRAYRIGQTKDVTIYYPIARHKAFGNASFDVTLDKLLERKRTLSRDLLVPAESTDDYKDMIEATTSIG